MGRNTRKQEISIAAHRGKFNADADRYKKKEFDSPCVYRIAKQQRMLTDEGKDTPFPSVPVQVALAAGLQMRSVLYQFLSLFISTDSMIP